MKKTLAILFSLVLAFSGGASAAHADTDELQLEVNRILEEYPGGVQTGPGEISWDEGSVVLTLAGGSENGAEFSPFAAVGSCASGYFCAYSETNLTGSKISFSSCTAPNSVSPLGSAVRSVANGRGSGTVSAYNGSTVVLSVAANSYANTSATVTRLGC